MLQDGGLQSYIDLLDQVCSGGVQLVIKIILILLVKDYLNAPQIEVHFNTPLSRSIFMFLLCIIIFLDKQFLKMSYIFMSEGG